MRATTKCSWCRTVAPRPGDQRRQHARRAEIRQRTRAVLPAGASGAVPRAVLEGRARGRHRAGDAFETGTNAWRRLPAWPAGCASGCTIARSAQPRRGLTLGFDAPRASDAPFDEYVSALPSRCRSGRGHSARGRRVLARWLVDDQRKRRPSRRRGVRSAVLTAPVKISGQPIVNLVASTTGPMRTGS